jgi:hypothetical protein
MLTRADLDAIEARLTGRDPAAELALLRARLAECYAVIDAAARLHCPCTVREAARLLLTAHGRPPWSSPKEVAGEKA